MLDLQEMRTEYKKASLDESSVPIEPFSLFETWFSQAIEAQIKDPNSMILATSSKENCVENKSEKNKKRITEIVNYIGQHYQDDLCIQDIANHFSISNNHLSKLFKENLNITVKTYLTSVRIKYVKKDLLETDLPLIDIAISNGFPNLKSLNREMEKDCNMTASKYRKTVKKVKNM